MKDGNKRVNLTFIPEIYEKMQAFKEKNGITSDASAAMQLIVRQLISLEQAEAYTEFMRSLPPEKIADMAQQGIKFAITKLNAGESIDEILSDD